MTIHTSESVQNIERVANNQEKFNNYKENLTRYNKAKANGFYFECLFILYAMLEDRASAFLYHLGFTSEDNRTIATYSKKIKKQIRQILEIAEGEKYNLAQISNKLRHINKVIEWSQSVTGDMSEYQKSVKTAVNKLSANENFLNALDVLDKWRDMRNQFTHALFNKNPQAVVLKLEPFIEEGYSAIRILDSAVRQLKSKKIRAKYKIK